MANYVMEIGEVTKVKLHGHIDASIAPELMNELKPLIERKDEIKKIGFLRGRIGIHCKRGDSLDSFRKTKTRRKC